MDHERFRNWFSRVDELTSAQPKEVAAVLSGPLEGAASLAAIALDVDDEPKGKPSPDYVPSSSCSIDRVDCAVGSVQRAPNRSEWAARRHVSGPNPVPVPVWSLEHEVRT